MLSMLARQAEPPGPLTITMKDAGRPITIRNWPAEHAFWAAAVAAATFAGRFEAFRQARDDRWPTQREIALRQAVEQLVGPDGGMPPPLSAMPEKVGPTRLGVTPRKVHARAWRSHLAANVSRLTMVKVKERGYL